MRDNETVQKVVDCYFAAVCGIRKKFCPCYSRVFRMCYDTCVTIKILAILNCWNQSEYVLGAILMQSFTLFEKGEKA